MERADLSGEQYTDGHANKLLVIVASMHAQEVIDYERNHNTLGPNGGGGGGSGGHGAAGAAASAGGATAAGGGSAAQKGAAAAGDGRR